MRVRPSIASVVVALTLSTLASAAAADGPTASSFAAQDGYGYRFNDDAMVGGGLLPSDPRLHVVPHAARGLLIRPRTQFIAEMLKSVENL
jgi:hypothetical protein